MIKDVISPFVGLFINYLIINQVIVPSCKNDVETAVEILVVGAITICSLLLSKITHLFAPKNTTIVEHQHTFSLEGLRGFFYSKKVQPQPQVQQDIQ